MKRLFVILSCLATAMTWQACMAQGWNWYFYNSAATNIYFPQFVINAGQYYDSNGNPDGNVPSYNAGGGPEGPGAAFGGEASNQGSGYYTVTWTLPTGIYGPTSLTIYPGQTIGIPLSATPPPPPPLPTTPYVDDTMDNGPQSEPDCGMPVWGVTEPFISLWLTDEPLGYQPAVGPRISFKLSYDQREATTGYNTSVFGVGKKWECSWLSYVYIQGNTNVVYSGGGSAFYYWPVYSTPSYWHNTYAGTGLGDSTNSMIMPGDYRNNSRLCPGVTNGFNVYYPDGSMDYYGFAVTNTSGTLHEVFLSQRYNSVGQCMTFNYASYQPSAPVVRLVSVIDGDGRTNRIYYNTSNSISTNLISMVVDAFGRTNFLSYNTNGDLTNITDVAGNSSSVNYSTNDLAASLTTPYGTTSFSITDGTNSAIPNGRSILVSRPDASRELFLYTDSAAGQPSSYPSNAVPNIGQLFYRNTGPLNSYNSYHWGPRQYAALSTTNIASFTGNDFFKGRMKHWELDWWATDQLASTVALEREPSPDGAGMLEGKKAWYLHYYSLFGGFELDAEPILAARILPDGSTSYVSSALNAWGKTLFTISTYSGGLRTNFSGIDPIGNGIDQVAITNALGVLVSSNAYNSNHEILQHYDALNEMTSYTYNANQQVTSVTQPDGLVTTNIYGANNLLTQQIVIGFSTNSFTYVNDLVATHTDARGLTTVNTWDNLNRLTSTTFPDGSYVSNIFSRLDLVATRDRMGNWSYLGYDNLQRNTSVTNALGNVTLYNYCSCGALASILDAATNLTQFYYDNQGNTTNVAYADGFSKYSSYNLLRQVIVAGDSSGNYVTNYYNNQGLLTLSVNSMGLVSSNAYDLLDRITNHVNANGVRMQTTYDNLDRHLTRSYPDGGVERWGYSLNFPAATSFTNQIGNVCLYAYDTLGRKTSEVSVGVSTNSFAYDGAGDLLTLADGRNQVTAWNYDTFGRVTNKVDPNGVVDFAFQYDSDDRLISRWTPAKGNTTYTYDAVGNRTSINYPLLTISFAYDSLNRPVNMVDGLGATRFSYTAAGQLLTAGGLWNNDMVTNTYSNRLRTGLGVGSWSQTFGYDAATRLTSITSPAGSFGYAYDATNHLEVASLSLPDSAYITNNYDPVGRLAGTSLNNSGNTALDGYAYVYNLLGQRTNIVRNLGTTNSTVTAGYDAIGEVTSWAAKDSNGPPRLNEQLGYAYDAAGNLSRRTNNALIQSFTVDAANTLTNIVRTGLLTVSGSTFSPATGVTVNGQPALTYGDATFASSNAWALVDGDNSFTNVGSSVSGGFVVTNVLTTSLPQSVTLLFDANGNLTNDGVKTYGYDAENQLTNVTLPGVWQKEFLYDGLNRRRITRDFIWSAATSGWMQTNETRFVYDGNAVLQEWDANDSVRVSYTRGMNDLLARTDANGSAFYHADGNHNITAMVNLSQNVVARYLYDPYGRLLGKWGGLADANAYRFAGKEWNEQTGFYYFAYRYYSPNLQRWLNRDPLGENGGLNLYGYVGNNPINNIDPLGLYIWQTQYWADLSQNGAWWQQAAAWPLGILSAAIPDTVGLSGGGTAGSGVVGSIGADNQLFWATDPNDPCHGHDVTFTTVGVGRGSTQAGVTSGISLGWANFQSPTASSFTGDFNEGNITIGDYSVTLWGGGGWTGITIGLAAGAPPVSASYQTVNYQFAH